tara:strand:+ start:7069 stop:7275 length:207 start_codon:yes stop_codon:yes gene_type:complete
MDGDEPPGEREYKEVCINKLDANLTEDARQKARDGEQGPEHSCAGCRGHETGCSKYRGIAKNLHSVKF